MSAIPHALRDAGTQRGFEYEVTDDIHELLAVLPDAIANRILELQDRQELGELIEIVLDLGRPPTARYQRDEIELADLDVSRSDLGFVAERIGQFGDDNRAGIERTLHRISAIRNRAGEIVGLTCRIGRAVYGTIAIISDLIESGQSVLLLGRPGVGKTTLLRETARVLADELRKRVIVVDTSNEIAGDGDIPHPAIGRARRMQVPTPTAQHAVMIEAVENHMPQVVVIDEIGTELEAMAARTIAERGVQLIGTAHGNTLENLMLNPTLSDLIGGIQSVTLSDEEARRRGTQKSILERKAPPTFNVMVEIVDRDEVIVHLDVAATVDALLRSAPLRSEYRRRDPESGAIETSASDDVRRNPTAVAPRRTAVNGARNSESVGETSRRTFEDLVGRSGARTLSVVENTPAPPASPAEEPATAESRAAAPTVAAFAKGRGTSEKPLRIFPFGVSRNRLDQSIYRLQVPAVIVRNEHDADIVLTLKNTYRQKAQPVRDAELRGIPVYVLRSNTNTQMENVLISLFPHLIAERTGQDDTAVADEPEEPAPERRERRMNDVVVAMSEAEDAITAVMQGAPATALRPQSPPIRRMQHELAERYNLASRSRGRDPFRHVEIYRRGMQ
ncbi:MAG TPA: R3H domain-containing nucleic acid-binding protein [Thermomicrobiales bacterium]|nr:R3H domain-containing nucleic acid-binding protein [Thermomicrobiales bacterium]